MVSLFFSIYIFFAGDSFERVLSKISTWVRSDDSGDLVKFDHLSTDDFANCHLQLHFLILAFYSYLFYKLHKFDVSKSE